MNNETIIRDLIERIISIEHENMVSADAENNDIRGRIVNSILAELDKVVPADED